MIKRIFVMGVLALAMVLVAQPAFAGSPHFVTASKSVSGNTITATFKEAGLGGEAQIDVVLSADASCVNPGTHHPKAANKTTVSAGESIPVQNGRAEGSISATATFQPDCTPPMTVVYSNVSLCDITNGICTDP